MTDNLPAKDQKREIRLPIIVCPFCGEKEPHKLALTTVDQEYDLENVNWMWTEPNEPIPEPTHQNSKVTINGECMSCLTTFKIIISARTPYK